jgi:hypothetical protein
MPRYFFNLYNDVTTLDEEGRELPGLASAEAHGLTEARTMAADSVTMGHINLHHRIEIADERGEVLKTIHFGDAVKIKG